MGVDSPSLLSEEIIDFLCANLDTLTVRDLARIRAIVNVVIPKDVSDLIGYIEAIGDADES